MPKGISCAKEHDKWHKFRESDEEHEGARPGPAIDGDGAGGEGGAGLERIFMYEFQLNFKQFEDRVVDSIG